MHRTKGSPWAQGELSAKLTEGIRTLRFAVSLDLTYYLVMPSASYFPAMLPPAASFPAKEKRKSSPGQTPDPVLCLTAGEHMGKYSVDFQVLVHTQTCSLRL